MSILTISKKEQMTHLEESNPWWKGDSYSSLPKEKRSYFDGFQKLVLNEEVQRAIILMGPRRIGKTVLLKQFIVDVLKKKKFTPSDVFFISIDDPIFNNVSLQKFVDLFKEKFGLNTETKKLMVFDEIQYLKDWAPHLKVLVDKYPKIKFIASGSAAAALNRKSSESGAGRLTNFFLPPLTFEEFIDLSKIKPRDIKDWNKHFIDYINFGCYPEVILNKSVRKNTRRFIKEDIIDKVLLKDLPSLYGISDTQELNRFLVTLAFNSGNEINLEGLSQDSGIAKNTIIKYLKYLESSFLIKRVHRIDDSCKKLQRSRTFKVYLTSPSMHACLFNPITNEDQDIGRIIETTVFSQYLHIGYSDNLYYARWKKNNVEYEVDLVIMDEAYNPKTLLEIKWSDRYITRPEELKGLLNLAFKHNIKQVLTTSKTTIDIRKVKHKDSDIEILSQPCSLFCYNMTKTFLEYGGINKKILKNPIHSFFQVDAFKISAKFLLKLIKIEQPISSSKLFQLLSHKYPAGERQVSHQIDFLRKKGFIIRKKNGDYVLTYEGLKSVPLKMNRNSSDIKRMLELKEKQCYKIGSE